MKKMILFFLEIILVIGLTFLAWPIASLESYALQLILKIVLNVLLGCSGFVMAKLSGLEIDFCFKKGKQYLFGIGISVILSLLIAWIPAFCGHSLVGDHADLIPWEFVFQFLNYVLIIGPSEEMVFRVYFQKFFVSLFKEKQKWIGVLIASFLFGLWHLINGSLLQVLFTFLIGCVFGFSKEYLKDFHYPGIALCHGLYDFLNYVVRLLVV